MLPVNEENEKKIADAIKVIKSVFDTVPIPLTEIAKVKEIRRLEYEVRQLERELNFYQNYVTRFNSRGRGSGGYRGRGSYQPY